jgi:ParB family chromosome partitioning protein
MSEHALSLRLDAIAPDPEQPRRQITPESLAGLVLSIRAHGVISPILVSAHPDAERHPETPFMLVVGERRWAAARGAGLRSIPARVCREPLSPSARLMLQIEENEGELRHELSLAERVAAVSRAFRLSGLRQEAFAVRHGKTPSWLSHYLALAGADDLTRAALAEGHLHGINTARLFLRLGEDDRRALLERARRNRLPITDKLIEAAAESTLRAGSRPTAPPLTLTLTPRQLAELLRLLGQQPGATTDEQLRQLRSLLA